MGKLTYSELARQYYNWFESKYRDEEGQKDRFVCLKEGAPDELKDLVWKAHDNGEFLPDDYRYDWIQDALGSIADSDADDADELDNYDLNRAREELEPDAYCDELAKWFFSNINRARYVDEAVNELEWSKEGGVYAAIGWGQLREKEETYSQVHEALSEIWNDIKEDEDEEIDE